MVKLWSSTRSAPTLEQFETQQQKLARLSGDILAKHRQNIDTEVNDPERLRAVYGSRFMEAGAVRQAETVALMASQMLNAPNAMVNVILPDRQATVATVTDGVVVPSEDSPRRESFCQHVIGTGREFAVEDAGGHPLVCDTKWSKEGIIVSYLGVPIANPQAIIIGVLCVFDATERNWSPADVTMLTQLSMVLTRATAQ